MKGRMLVLIACLMLILAAPIYGQTGMGSISGTVMDPSAAVVPGVAIKVTNTATGVVTTTKTTPSGIYEVLQLIPGPYALEVETQGFKKTIRQGITVQVGDRLTINLTLELGSSADAVSVVAEAPLLRTEDAQAGEVITNKAIENLPQLNRDPLQLLQLAGNVQGDGCRAGEGNSCDTRINGGRTSSVEYYIDGITAGTGRLHAVADKILTPSMDDVAEFKVITNGISAEYGRISGGAVEVVTRSGTNALHGQVFEYLKNDHFNANTWQQNYLGGEKTPFRNNDFGFTLGGPLYLPKVYNGRNKTFFFANYEGLRFSQSGTLRLTSVPTEAERQGDFSQTMFDGVPAMLYDPDGPQVFQDGVWQRTLPLGGDGKHVPASRISPVTAALLKTVPMPNHAGRANTSSADNFVGPQNELRSSDSWSLRLDHNFTANQRIFGRFSTGTQDHSQTRWYSSLSTAPEDHIKDGRTGTVNYNWTLTPTLLFEARAGIYHNPFNQGNVLPAGFTDTIPFDSVTAGIMGSQNLPTVYNQYMCSNDCLTLSNAAGVKISNSTTYHVATSLVKIAGRHTVKVGYEMRRYYDNFYQSGDGHFELTSNPVNRYAVDDSSTSEGLANGLGGALLGINDWAWAKGANTRAIDQNYHGAFVQDDFKVNTKLTLNVGLRWDLETSPTERHDKLYFWDPDAQSQFKINPGWDFRTVTTAAGLSADLPLPSWVQSGFPQGAIRLTNTPEFPSRTFLRPNYHQFAPRLGLAYQIDRTTVFRASLGKMYMSTSGDPNGLSRGSLGNQLSDAADAGWHATNDGMRHLISNFENPYLPSEVTHYTRDNQVANYQATGWGAMAYNRDSHQPYELTWNVGIQRELPARFLVETYYAANRGVRLLGPDFISKFPKELFAPANAAAMTTPVDSPTAGQTRSDAVVGPQQQLAFLYYSMPYYGPSQILGSNIGRSSFNAWNTRVERRFAQGFSLLLNYTLSRSLDNIGGPEDSFWGISAGGLGFKSTQNVDPATAAWGLSPFDETHRLGLTYLVELPIGRGKPLLGNPQSSLAKTVLDYAIGGWEFSGFTLYRSGRPVIIQAGNLNVNNNVRVEVTYGSYATSDHNLSNAAYTDARSLLYSIQDPRADGMVRRFDPTKIADAQPFTYGTLPAIFGDIRNPGNNMTNLSLMKKFRFNGDGSRYLQLRMEALNAFNQPGLGSYHTTIGSPDFGLITSRNNPQRQAQISARLIF